MGKWAYELKKDRVAPNMVLVVFGLLGMAVLILGFALTANSAPSGYNNPVVFGHHPIDVEPGTFSGTPGQVYGFPGTVQIGSTTSTGVSHLDIFTSAAGGNDPHIKLGGDSISQWVLGVDVSDASKLKISNTLGSIDFLTILQSSTPPNTALLGIGTTSPTAKVHIGGIAGTDGLRFPDGTLQTTAFTGSAAPLWSASGTNISNTNTGNVGIGIGSPANKLDVSGNVQATQDICTSLNGGKCLSKQGTGIAPVATTGLVRKCNPLPCGTGNLLTASGTVDVTCDPGYLPVSCGGGVRATGGSVRQYLITPLYSQPPLSDGKDGCRLTWDTSGGSAWNGGAIAVCAPIGP